jgi:hypothetical protein
MTAVLARWLPLAGVVTILCLLVYLAVQQVWRHAADDPQIQMATDIADALASGATTEAVVPRTSIDVGRSLAPFVMLLDDRGTVLASSGALRGGVRRIPDGVLQHVRAAGEERMTWQPEPGIRIATVVVRVSSRAGGFVVVGRSLRETQARIAQFGTIVAAVWIGSLLGLLLLIAALRQT